MKTKKEILDIMAHADATTAYHRYSYFPGFPVATDGIIAVAEAAECFWLLNAIGNHQRNQKLDPNFQVWILTCDHDTGVAVLQGMNDTELVVEQKINNTDFPLDSLKMFVMNGVILLPSEY